MQGEENIVLQKKQTTYSISVTAVSKVVDGGGRTGELVDGGEGGGGGRTGRRRGRRRWAKEGDRVGEPVGELGADGEAGDAVRRWLGRRRWGLWSTAKAVVFGAMVSNGGDGVWQW
nr:hypothetical protein Itr_chr13CG11940 [Ipomoea trifida]